MAGDQLGGKVLADGSVKIYKNGLLVAQTNVVTPSATNVYPFPAAKAAQGGYVGIWVIGANTGSPTILDDFRGGNITQ